MYFEALRLYNANDAGHHCQIAELALEGFALLEIENADIAHTECPIFLTI